ncbi:MAG: hypothetical protein D6712_06115 [Chloroflexi bacterium]|nr:MAG: hypothetical protein D6712_06115 [Chloroflexota bacterium]
MVVAKICRMLFVSSGLGCVIRTTEGRVVITMAAQQQAAPIRAQKIRRYANARKDRPSRPLMTASTILKNARRQQGKNVI